jgi:hypothetical protein
VLRPLAEAGQELHRQQVGPRATRAPPSARPSAAAGRRAEPGWRDEAVLLSPGLLLAPVSSQTGFNHHLRYVLPALPFLFVWAGRVAALAPAWNRIH